MTDNYDDIFEKGNASDLGAFFKFQNVGDKVAGTYIDLMEGIDGYGNEQYIVVLQEKDGTKHRVSVRKSHTVLVDRLKAVRFGQIVGFLFEEERESKMAGGNKSKIINIKQNPTMVDEAWIKDKLETDAKYGIPADVSLTPKFSDSAPTPSEAAPSATEGATPVAASAPAVEIPTPTDSPVSGELASTIKTLMVNKGFVTEEATDAEVADKVVAVSGMEFTAENGPAIINKIAVAS